MILYIACFFQSLFQTHPQPTQSNSQFTYRVRPKVVELVDNIEVLYNHSTESIVVAKEHSLQAAHFARQEHPEASALVAATLLNNLNLFVAHNRVDKINQWVKAIWGEEVGMPILNSVQAKRFLAAIDPGYVANLSLLEQQLFIEQGGALAQDSPEYASFRKNPYFDRSLAVRRWNDQTTSCVKYALDFETFKPLLVEVAYTNLRLTYHDQEIDKVIELLEECCGCLKSGNE